MNTAPLLHIVLYQPEIPPNTGNIGRSCVATGCRLWLVEPLGFDISEKAVRRAGLDYWSLLDLRVVPDWQTLATELHEPFSAGRTWLFTKTAKQSYLQPRYQAGDVLIFGCETRGLPAEIMEQFPNQLVRIPMRPQVRSLNLSVTAGIAMYEAVRQLGCGDEYFEQ
ncbi:tRNA (cytidine(34)-2'-O)-methyltransferase [Anatilimnocola aggregata]|uniref:Putative tRNA (cytidine(34)-2'-O)-methyltransferase n=1 Tax=Anatilimnocola aggregata TaxID=2528021 RepID=A0A517YN71_9BACT|nr:tRNA (cytidine(34)-2'-O)-methyltransferase [Anatilimnocola aggregata]QDU31669.1 tRNA (cytidine(34)-2'-O)-methyltransferase [Anatilimnocola aggregata]